MATKPKGPKTVVVGAGPVGALAALYAANRGHQVEIYELRSDLRDPSTTPLNFTKSINLALSERGINALRKAECPRLVESILAETIPMHARMIHGVDAKGNLYQQSQQYDIHDRAILAIDRGGLNKRLLDELEKMPNVRILFNHKLTGSDFKRRTAWFERRDPKLGEKYDKNKRPDEIEVPFDFMIGADGAHSAVRYHLMKYARVNYQQEYIDTLWCEFHISPQEGGQGFRLSPNHLHIWPGGDFMFIAIPSLDHSFTCTLFLPASRFAQLATSHETLLEFFQAHVPGVVPDLISASDIQSQFDENPHLPLISIKCSPYHFESSCVILGDAAHAMVPFYGQGMNAGLEDVRVLFEFLDNQDSVTAGDTRLQSLARAQALEAYTAYRTPDAAAINDLAFRNYTEMRASVRSRVYQSRKWIEEHIDKWIPSLGWKTQYRRVSFENERYSDVVKAGERQGKIIADTLGLLALLAIGGGGSAILWRLRR